VSYREQVLRTAYKAAKELDVYGSVHHNTSLIEMTNKMQLCRTIYYSTVPCLLKMFRAIYIIKPEDVIMVYKLLMMLDNIA